jgi:hypothetical protein
MVVTLNLPAELEESLMAQAKAKGVPVDELVREAVMASQPLPAAAKLSPEERVRAFKEWVHSHSIDTPVLSDEAMSREFIYRERGE